jgi:AcrR family transcriptional regulator
VSATAAPPRPRHEEIVDALEETFLERGLDVTVGELADRAHCSRRTLYEIAPSKERLFVIALDRMLQRIGRQARDAAARQSSHASALREYMAAAQPQLRQVTPRFAQALESHRAARRVYERHSALARARLTQIVDAGVAAGEFAPHDPSLVAEVLLAVPQHPRAVDFLLDGLRAR